MAAPEGGAGEWMQFAASVIGGIGAAVLTIISWAFHAGRKEPELKIFVRQEISAAEQRLENKIEAADKRNDEKLDGLVKQFTDTFAAIRQKLNDDNLTLEREFLRKEDYKTLRNEDRANFAKFEARFFKEWDDFKRNVATMIGGQQ